MKRIKILKTDLNSLRDQANLKKYSVTALNQQLIDLTLNIET